MTRGTQRTGTIRGVGTWGTGGGSSEEEEVLQSCYRGVTEVLQSCYSGVTVVLQSCYSGVTVVLQSCYSGVTVVLQRGRSVTVVLQSCYRGGEVLQSCYSRVTDGRGVRLYDMLFGDDLLEYLNILCDRKHKAIYK